MNNEHLRFPPRRPASSVRKNPASSPAVPGESTFRDFFILSWQTAGKSRFAKLHTIAQISKNRVS